MDARNINGHLTATWVYCAKCGTGFVGDTTMRSCPGCMKKHRINIKNNTLDRWDWLAVSLIPLFGTFFCLLDSLTKWYY